MIVLRVLTLVPVADSIFR